MIKTLIDVLDDSMNAESPQDMPQDPQLRKEFYSALVQQVTQDWRLHIELYEKSISSLPEDAQRKANKAASKLQELCTQVIDELEAVPAQNYPSTSLFQAKELSIQFCAELNKFKKQIS